MNKLITLLALICLISCEDGKNGDSSDSKEIVQTIKCHNFLLKFNPQRPDDLNQMTLNGKRNLVISSESEANFIFIEYVDEKTGMTETLRIQAKEEGKKIVGATFSTTDQEAIGSETMANGNRYFVDFDCSGTIEEVK